MPVFTLKSTTVFILVCLLFGFWFLFEDTSTAVKETRNTQPEKVTQPVSSISQNTIRNTSAKRPREIQLDRNIEAGSIQAPSSQAILWGNVQTESGETVRGEILKLYSPSLNKQYQTVSNEYGEFLIHNIVPAPDYRITLSPAGMYQRYKTHVDIGDNQTSINVVLRKLQTADLRGRILDTKQNSVPGFKLRVRSLNRPGRISNITTDELGQFEVEGFPYGEIQVSTNLGQLVMITGIQFDTKAVTPLTLVIDTGPHSVSGIVYDGLGEAVPGANVLLIWEYEWGTSRNVTTRRTISDPLGQFSFNDLGEGGHELIISSSGAGVFRKTIQIGSETGQIEAILR